MDWEKTVAELVWEEICFANRGRPFKNVEELETCLRRFSENYRFIDGLPPQYAEMTDGRLCLPMPGDTVPVSHPVYPHELAEACTIWEGRAPYNVPALDMKEARHRVALLVEAESAAYEAALRVASEQRLNKMQERAQFHRERLRKIEAAIAAELSALDR